MPLQRKSTQPLYLQVAQQLEQDISTGVFPPYSRLLSESGLMRRFGVSRVTVRAAITRLVRKGLADVRQGKGTFVSGPIITQGLDAFTDIHDALVAQGFSPDRRLLDYRTATPEECRDTPFADAPAGPMLLRRLYVLHGKPFAMIHGLLAPDVSRCSPQEAAQRSIVEMLADYPGGVARADIAIRARPVSGDVGALLGLPRRRSVLVMERTSHATSGAVLDFSTFHIVPEAWEFRLAIDGPPSASDVEPRLQAPGDKPRPLAT